MTFPRSFRFVVCAIMASISLACAENKPAVPVKQTVLTNSGAVPTEAEGDDLARALEKAVKAADIQEWRRLIDWDAIMDVATSGIEVPDGFKTGFASGFLGAIEKPTGLLGQLSNAVKSGGEFTLLHNRAVGDTRRLLFRIRLGNQGINYHEYTVMRRPDGKARIVDFYVYLSGELFTQTIRRLYLPIAANSNRKGIVRLVAAESEFVKATPKFKDIVEAIQANRPADAMAIYAAFPESVQRDKTVQLLHVQIAQALNDEPQYISAIDEFRKNYPGDACIDLISIDGYFLRKQYDKALAAIERLNKSLGGDPYLDVLRGGCLLSEGKLEAAMDAARSAIKAEPTLANAYDLAIQIAVKQKRYDEAVKLIHTYEDTFGKLEFQFEADPDYAGFVKSPEYQTWLKEKGA
jgi:predicted negative regulator of RcsB-dependent stress response